MRHILTILSHEIRMLLVNPGTYIAAVLFLTLMGFIFTGMLEEYSQAAQENTPAEMFFQLFWVPVLFMVPLLTMKSIAEERRLGTLETLLTTPASTVEVVFGKFFAAYFLYICLWASTAGFFVILYKFAGDARFLDPGPMIGGYVFIAVSGLLFIAIGIFASSLARNQAVAALVSLTLLFILIVGLKFLPSVQYLNNEAMRGVKAAADYAQVFQHQADFTRGVIDARQLLFYVSGTVVMLIFSVLGIEIKLLHS